MVCRSWRDPLSKFAPGSLLTCRPTVVPSYGMQRQILHSCSATLPLRHGKPPVLRSQRQQCPTLLLRLGKHPALCSQLLRLSKHPALYSQRQQCPALLLRLSKHPALCGQRQHCRMPSLRPCLLFLRHDPSHQQRHPSSQVRHKAQRRSMHNRLQVLRPCPLQPILSLQVPCMEVMPPTQRKERRGRICPLAVEGLQPILCRN